MKTNRSFIPSPGLDYEDTLLCHAIIAMAHKPGLKLVAEGIETRQQRDLSQAAGCDYGQD